MAKVKQLGMAAGTFSVALGIGFVMQNGDALASRFGADTSAPAPAPFTADDAAQVQQVNAVDDLVVAPAEPIEIAEAPQLDMPDPSVAAAVKLPPSAQIVEDQDAPTQLATLDPEIAPVLDEEPVIAEATDCVPEMVGAAGAGATVKIVVTAHCHLETAFTVHHSGMMFSGMTDGSGQSTLSIPALSEVAVFIAAFDNGEGAVATAFVPDFANYDRAVLQWEGDTSVMLSAYEGGSDFGEAGHIYAGNPGDMARLTTAEGGYLVRLGDASVEGALMAEVYTFPSGMDGVVSDVMLVAEAEITAGNCGQDISAQSIQVTPDGITSALDLTLTMPECDAVGDILILQNMFQDLTLAAR